MELRIPRLRPNAQTLYLIFGAGLPLFLVWAGLWVMFEFPSMLSLQFLPFLDSVVAQGVASPWVYANIFVPLYEFGNGIFYYVFGILLFALAIILSSYVGGRLGLKDLKPADLRVRSLVLAVIVLIVIVGVIVAVGNHIMLDSLLDIQKSLSAGV